MLDVLIYSARLSLDQLNFLRFVVSLLATTLIGSVVGGFRGDHWFDARGVGKDDGREMRVVGFRVWGWEQRSRVL